MSLSELRQKDVINTRDGQCLGKPMTSSSVPWMGA